MLLLAACAPEDAPWTFAKSALDDAIAGYTDWASPRGWEDLSPSCTSAHGTYVRVYVDANAAAEDDASGPYSVGSTLVLDGLQDSVGTWKMTVAMHKVEADSPLVGDWYWGQYDADGALVYSGDVPACWSCHQDAKDFAKHRGRPPEACGDTGAPI